MEETFKKDISGISTYSPLFLKNIHEENKNRFSYFLGKIMVFKKKFQQNLI
jgi:hypothetical protein